MSLVESLKAAGFKPEANTDGEFKALRGTYECSIVTLRSEVDAKNSNAKFYQLELKPTSALEGDTFGDKFHFKRRYYADGEKATENLKKLVNDMFTCGVTLDLASDSALEQSFSDAIGKTAFVRSWGWTPEGKDEQQSFVIQKAGVAAKRKKAEAVPF